MIPKIIHFVWVGSCRGSFPLPDVCAANMQAWRDRQTDYTVMFWNESNLPSLDAEQAWAYKHGRNAGETSDVIRHNVLQQFGGYSMDMDIQPVAGMGLLQGRTEGFRLEHGYEPSAVTLTDGSRVLGTVPGGRLINEICRRLPIVIANALHKTPDLKAAVTGWKLITAALDTGFGAGEVLQLPGAMFPTAGSEDAAGQDVIGVHDFAAEWIKQIA